MENYAADTTFFAISLCFFGICLGVIGNKFVASRYTSGLKWIFYSFGALSIIVAVYYFIQFFQGSDIDYVILCIFLISGVTTICITRKINKRNIYKIKELNKEINKFTGDSDTGEIKLFGGDLDFFGNTPDMDTNIQYQFLGKAKFKKILVLCEEPMNVQTKKRYGKILSDFNDVELRFYQPGKADLKIRGRMSYIHSVLKVLIYRKVCSGSYELIESDMADPKGVLYGDIWNLVWSLARTLGNEQREEYINLSRGE